MPSPAGLVFWPTQKRASEIANLKVSDVRIDIPRMHIKVRVSAAKGGYPRIVPLWWDAGTLADIKSWKVERSTTDESPNRPFVISLRPGREGTTLSRHTLRKRFRTACKVLGDQRLNNLTIHHGRHTFISHTLAGGRTLAEVRDAAEHSCVSLTSIYLHIAVDDDGKPGNLFGNANDRVTERS